MSGKQILACLALAAISHTATAQSAAPKRYTAKLAGTVVARDVEDKYSATIYNREMPEVDGGEEGKQLDELKAASARQFPRKAIPVRLKTTAAPMPVLGNNFIADSLGGIPSDNYMAINNSGTAISVINQTIAMHNANTGAYILRKNLKLFSTATGLNSVTQDYRYDPKVIYDPEADRFICVMLNSINARNYIVLGFTATNDPTGVWNFYKFYGDYSADTTWFDYPAISITNKEFFLTGNKIKYDSSWQAGFKRTVIYQVNKQDGYNGDTALTYQIWDNIAYAGRNIRCLHPVKSGITVGGPQQYFLSDRNFDISNDTIFLVKVPDTIGGSSALTVTPLVSSVRYGIPPDGRQPDTNYTLATNDGRILGAYINNDQIQFVSASVYPATGASAVYHGTINNVSTSPTVTAAFITVDSLDFGYPNISYAGSGVGTNKSIISFNYTGPRTQPGMGAVYFDGSGYSSILNVKSGDSSIHLLSGKQQRWGDYTGSQPEWNAPGVVWVEGIFGRRNHAYGNYMAQIKSPEFTAVPGTQPSVNKATLFPNPSFTFITLEFDLPADQVLTFSILDMSGKLVDKLPDALCHDGTNVLQFNTQPLAPGNYLLRVTGSKGYVNTLRFSRN